MAQIQTMQNMLVAIASASSYSVPWKTQQRPKAAKAQTIAIFAPVLICSHTRFFAIAFFCACAAGELLSGRMPAFAKARMTRIQLCEPQLPPAPTSIVRKYMTTG